MKHTLLTFLCLAFTTIAFGQDFITVWDMSNTGSSPTSITFGVGTTGVVNYTWETIPAGATGSGTFSGTTATITGLPSNAIIKLSINPTNFDRFYINTGADKARLKDVKQWGAVVWSTMNSAFLDCIHLQSSAIDIPDLSQVTDMTNMFAGTWSFNSPIGNWSTANVTNMSYMFKNANFNQPIGNWNTSNVTNMSGMFSSSDFNHPIGNWNTSNVTNMSGMFSSSDFNQPIGNWNTSNVIDMSYMFYVAVPFNQPIGTWNTANITDMSSMFREAYDFNQPIGNWNTANVTDVSEMFWDALSFNQPLSNWNTTNMIDMYSMFAGAVTFNQPIGNWNTANVTNMSEMFHFATDFNQPISNWDVSNVTDMKQMFRNSYFNQPIDTWTLNSNVDLNGMLDNCGLDCSNYSSALHSWATNLNTPNGRHLGSYGRWYGNNVQSDRNYLITTKGWIITNDNLHWLSCCISQTPTSSTQNLTVCNSFLFNNQTLTASGTYYDTLVNANGCDSIITLNLTINNVNTAVSQSGALLTSSAIGATYQWITCPNMLPISGATNQAYTATANGDYAVVVTQNTCSDTSICLNVIGVGTTNLESINPLLSIYPNPATQTLTIELIANHFTNEKLELFNSIGQMVYSTSLINKQSKLTIDVSAFAKGVYLLKFEVKVQKVVVE